MLIFLSTNNAACVLHDSISIVMGERVFSRGSLALMKSFSHVLFVQFM